jgi:hypothetical protein
MDDRINELLAWWQEMHQQEQQLFFPVGSMVRPDSYIGPGRQLPAQPPALPARARQCLTWICTVPSSGERGVRFNGGLVRRAMEAAMDRDPARAGGGPGMEGSDNEPGQDDDPCRQKIFRLWLNALYALATSDSLGLSEAPELQARLRLAKKNFKTTRMVDWTEAAMQARREFATVGGDAGSGVQDPEAADDGLPMATLQQTAATEGFLHETGHLGAGRLAALYALRVVCKTLALPGDEGVLKAVRVPIVNAFREVRRVAPAEWLPLATTLAWELERLLETDDMRLFDQKPWNTALRDLTPGFNPLLWLDSLDPAPLQRWLEGRRKHCPRCDEALAPWPSDWLGQARRLAAAACRDLFDPHRAQAVGWFGGSRPKQMTRRLVADLVVEIDPSSLRNRNAQQPEGVAPPRWQAALAHRCEVRAYAKWLYAIAPLPRDLPAPPAQKRDTFHLKPVRQP